MERKAFRAWLLHRFGEEAKNGAVADGVARCERIEKSFGVDLGQINAATILYLLTYSKDDEQQHRPLPPGLKINGNAYNCMAALKNAAKLYLAFRNGYGPDCKLDGCGDTLSFLDDEIVDGWRSGGHVGCCRAEEVSNGTSRAESSTKQSKAIERLPLWAKRNEDNPYRIIRAFLKLGNVSGDINSIRSLDKIRRLCSNKALHPDMYVEKFRGCWASLKTDKGNSYGRMFVQNGDDVSLPPELALALEPLVSDFLKQ